MSDADSPAPSPVDEHLRDDDAPADASDKESDLLSEIDEDQFDDYQDNERPVDIDENVAKTLKAAKRKRATTESEPQKPKEGRRPKKRPRADDDDGEGDAGVPGGAGGDAGGESRARRSRGKGGEGGERRAAASKKNARASKASKEENMTPEERRRLEVDRAIDAAIKKPSRRRGKKDEIDLEQEVDEQIAELKVAMEQACVADNTARDAGQPAQNKLTLLPQVTAMLNRHNVQDSVLDPETNFLQSVKFFLEPLNDGSLPAYNIQRDIFTALTSLPISKDVLLSSGIGKVVLFYTRSKKPELTIKRMAERLMGEWSRPVLKRSDDFKKRLIETREFDVYAATIAQQKEAAIGSSQYSLVQRPGGVGTAGARGLDAIEAEKQRLLAPEPRNSNRAQPVGLPASYTIAPRSKLNSLVERGKQQRPIGATGARAFQRLAAKNKARR